jgi:hypothetical protein
MRRLGNAIQGVMVRLATGKASTFSVCTYPGTVDGCGRGKGTWPTILLTALVLSAISPQPASSQDKLKVIDRPTITVEPFCNPEGKATGNLILRNEGSAPVPIHLSGGDLSSKAPAEHLIIQPELTPKDTTLGPNQELAVQATVARLYSDGDWESAIQNDGVDVGTLRIVKTTPPFSLSLDVPTPEAPELDFLMGKPGSFRLKNADPQQYQIAWEYSVNGRAVGSGDPGSRPGPALPGRPGWFSRWFHGSTGAVRPEGTVPPADASLMIPAGGQQEIIFSPPREWFGNSFAGLFKDDAADARLTVSLVEPGCPTASPVSRTFKVKTHLATSAGAGREGWADFWVFVFLALGGMFSLGLNSLLPNQVRRLKMKDQLSKLGAQISNLPYDLASRLRVLVGLEQRLIIDRLRNLTWTSADFSEEMKSIDQAMTRLGRRLQFLEQLGTTRTNFTKMRFEVLPPSVIFAMEQTFEKIFEIGEKSDPADEDVQAALTLIKSVQDQLDRGVQGNADFAKGLASRVTKFKLEFDATSGRIGKTDTCKRIREHLPGPFARLHSTDEKTITAAPDDPSAKDYIDLDGRLFDLERIREYVDLVEGMCSTDDLRKKIVGREAELLSYLKRRNCEAMYAARLLTRQMKDGYFKDDVKTEIEAKKIRIKVDHGEVRQFDPCEFRLEFLKRALNTAYAREEWTCRWTFTLGKQNLVEEGWVVTHYFQEGSQYKLKITLTHDGDATEVQVPDVEVFPKGEISVVPETRRRLGQAARALLHGRWSEANKARKSPRHAGNALDYLRLAMALVIALFGLIAGAKEQLLKLDVLPALLAVFMVGFGADQIKNLLTQKPPGGDTNPPQ